MICKPCADAADNGRPGSSHPADCSCDCAHKTLGSWNGRPREGTKPVLSDDQWALLRTAFAEEE